MAATYAVSLPTPRSSTSSSPSGMVTPWTYTTMVEQTPHTDTRDLPPLPPPPSALQPLRKPESPQTPGKAFSPHRRRDPPLHGLGWLVVIPGLIVVLLSAGLATTFFLYLLMRRDGDAPSFVYGFYVDEMTNAGSPLLGLLVSTIITNVVWLLGFPILISMTAYCIAGSWLSYQQHPRSERPNLLTPLQYGLLFKLLSAPGPASAYQVGSYIANRRSRVATPAFFTTAFFLVSGVLSLTYLISAADIWLHAVSAVVVVTPSPSSPAFPGAPSPPVPPFDASPDLSATLSATSAAPPPQPVLCGHYPLAPALTYILLLYLHALLAATLTLWTALLRSPRLTPALASSGSISSRADVEDARSATTTWPAPPIPTALRLAHLHLTDALAPVAARLSARREAHPAVGRLGPGLFVEDVNTARVEVGVWARDGGGGRKRWGDMSGDRVFGVYKKVLPWKGEIY
ncbi:hypothetical protein K438DRAFT_1174484 [Mycena galopus ATCC 62051]|nr:hypothetical protein K438DRAFT_1174484 [Mycena galopus ATCC 62051]